MIVWSDLDHQEHDLQSAYGVPRIPAPRPQSGPAFEVTARSGATWVPLGGPYRSAESPEGE